jgi:hypothetical protein
MLIREVVKNKINRLWKKIHQQDTVIPESDILETIEYINEHNLKRTMCVNILSSYVSRLYYINMYYINKERFDTAVNNNFYGQLHEHDMLAMTKVLHYNYIFVDKIMSSLSVSPDKLYKQELYQTIVYLFIDKHVNVIRYIPIEWRLQNIHLFNKTHYMELFDSDTEDVYMKHLTKMDKDMFKVLLKKEFNKKWLVTLYLNSVNTFGPAIIDCINNNVSNKFFDAFCELMK